MGQVVTPNRFDEGLYNLINVGFEGRDILSRILYTKGLAGSQHMTDLLNAPLMPCMI